MKIYLIFYSKIQIMLLIKNSFIIYFILVCFCYNLKIRKKSELIVYNNGQLLFNFFVILSFFVIYVLGLRLLNLFRINQSIDLNDSDLNITFILIFILIFNLRKLIIYLFKVSWFKFHYVMMCENNFSENVNKKYKFFYYNIVYIPAFYTFKYFIYMNYFMVLLLVLTFIYDIIFNNLILNYSLYFLKYYSFFKLIYFGYNFMITKQNLVLDYYSYSLLYPGSIEKSFFMTFLDSDHKHLMEESKKYSSSVILEKFYYVSEKFVNTAEMPYFKNLRR